jgi:signal transduction histidine kinase
VKSGLQLEQRIEIQAYYIVTELINNTIKHAKPNFIDGDLEIKQEYLVLTLKHDGVAIDQDDYEYLLAKNQGIGLSSLAHRLGLIGGQITFERFDRGGSIILKIPYNDEDKQAN